MRQSFDGLSLDMKKLTPKIPKPDMKRAMPFIQELKKRLDAKEPSDKVFDRKLPFDEAKVLEEMVPYLKATVKKCAQVEVVKIEGEEGKKKGVVVVAAEGKKVGEEVEGLPQSAEQAVPGRPTFFFTNV